MPRVAPRPDRIGPPNVAPAPDPPPETGIALAWAVLSRRSVTVNAAVLGVLLAATAIGLVLALGPAGVGAAVAALGVGKGAQAVGKWRRQKARRSTSSSATRLARSSGRSARPAG